MQTKKFHIGDIMSVVTGRVLGPRTPDRKRFDGCWELLDFMSGEDLFITSLGRVGDEAAPYLLNQFPFISEIVIPELSENVDDLEKEIDAWLLEISAKYGEWHEVMPIPPDDHEVLDPREDIRRINPDIEIIAFSPTEDEPPSPYGDIDWKE